MARFVVPVRTILVVDDHPDVLDLLQVVFESEGYHVLTAEDGLEAVEVSERLAPTAIVMDLWMPRLDGVGAAKRIRASGVQVPIIAHTAHPATLAHHKPLFTSVCVKPCEPAHLLAVVARALDGMH